MCLSIGGYGLPGEDMNKNHLRREYGEVFNRLKIEWNRVNQIRIFGFNGFIPDQLNQFILSRSALIKRLGQLQRELEDA